MLKVEQLFIRFRHLILHCADLHNRDHVLLKTVLIVNLEVKDNHEEAAIGARLTLDFCHEVCLTISSLFIYEPIWSDFFDLSNDKHMRNCLEELMKKKQLMACT